MAAGVKGMGKLRDRQRSRPGIVGNLLLLCHAPQEAQVIRLDGLLTALFAELAYATVIVQDEPWGVNHRQEVVKDLLSGPVMRREVNRSRLIFSAENDRCCFGLHFLVPS